MKKLIRVVRGSYTPEFAPVNAPGEWRRRLPSVIIPQNDLNPDHGPDYVKQGEFFLVEEEDLPLSMRTFAEGNPGCEVQVYGLEASAQCPAAPMVVKTVTKDGVLPA
jgi:hypothetical protein